MCFVVVDMESEQQQLMGDQMLTSDSALDFLTTTLQQTSETRFQALRDILVFLTSAISLGDRVRENTLITLLYFPPWTVRKE